MARGRRWSVSNSPKLQVVVVRAPHEANSMPDVRDSACHHRRLLQVRHIEITVRIVGAT